MARIRRVIRKIQPALGPAFDEQFWPVMLAMILLGGFLVGTTVAYLKFDDPRWYANAAVWLVIIPLLVGLTLLVLRFVDNRAIRRGVQLSFVLGVLVHFILILACVQTNVFTRFFDQIDQTTVPERQRLVARQYETFQLNPQQRREAAVNRPVETETPELTPPEPVPREEVEPEPVREPVREPEQSLAPQTEPVVEPNLTQRRELAETTPRQSQQTSQLSRQMEEVRPQPQQAVAVPQTRPAAPSRPADVEAQARTPQRQTAPAVAERAPTSETQQQATNVLPQVELTRRTPTEAPMPEASAAARIERASAPQETPSTEVAAAAAPQATPRQTASSELSPQSLDVRPQTAATSPAGQRSVQEPLVAAATEITPAERRENPAEPLPEIASAPRSVPNERPRLTPRPDVATVARSVDNNPSSSNQPQLEAATSSLSRAESPAAAAARPDVQPATAAEPLTADAPALARTSPRSAAPSDNTPASSTAATLARSPAASAAPPAQTTAEQITSAVQQPQSGELSPSSVATRRQPTPAPQTSPATGEPRPTSMAAATAIETVGSPRRNATAQVPDVAQDAAAPNAIARQSPAMNRPTTTAQASADGSQQAAASRGRSEPAAAVTAVARQSTSSPVADRAGTAGEPTATADGLQLATRAARRSESPAEQPSMTATSSSQPGSPARATATAALAPNLAATGPPSATAETGAGQPTMQPSRAALTRSLEGVSGVGQSPNFDRALAANESPSMVASGSARRVEATSRQPQGAALSPSAPAMVRQSLAGAERPSATLPATAASDSPLAGAAQPSELNASASASLTRSDAAAAQAETTAARGVADVDVGPTRVIDERGISRAAGGGQPVLSPPSDAPALARAALGGGATPPALNARADLPAAATGTGGGTPSTSELAPAPSLARRGDGGGSPAAAASQSTDAPGPSADGDLSDEIAAAMPARAGDQASRDAGALAAAAAAGGEEDEEERQRRLARAALGGAPQLAASAAALAEPTAAPASAATGVASGVPGGATAPMESAAGSLARAADADAPGSAPAASGLAGDIPGASAASGGGELVGSTLVQRAEAAAAAPKVAAAGGGTSSPARTTARQSLAAGPPTSQLALADVPAGGGRTAGPTAASPGDIVAQSTTTGVGRLVTGTAGTTAGSVATDGPGAGIEPGPAALARAASRVDGPQIGGDERAGAPLPRADMPLLAGGPQVSTLAEPARSADSSAGGRNDGSLLAMNDDAEPLSRQSAGAIPVELTDVAGPGGLGAEPTMDVGIGSRRARPDSLRLQSSGPRFARSEMGGLPSIATDAVGPADSFRGRQARMSGDAGGGATGGSGPETEEAIERGLAFLARNQSPDGSWSLQKFNEPVALVSDTAATGLALLAFQGAGYNHREYKYADKVASGINFLVKNQRSDGDLFIPLDDRSNASVWLYSHAIAAIALCEAYGMTQDPALRGPAQKAVDFIVESQHPTRGGWRYSPVEPFREADTSVTGWMMMALKSGELANLEVPDTAFTRIRDFLDNAQGQDGERHLYRYNPFAPNTPDKRHGLVPSDTMTAVGLLMRLYVGWKRDHPAMIRGADHLRQHLPDIGTASSPKRDTYYWYYATQLMFHMGGDYWDEWNGQLHPLLVESQITRGNMSGSWDPGGRVADAWAPQGGRLYVTTMNLLSLEVTYRHLPLYEETAR